MSDVDFVPKKSWFYRALPAITLMLLAPLIAEVLPGATRFSSIFVFPIQVLIWGGGAVMARFLVRKFRLGWVNLLLLAIALAVAEECLIIQTSFAPLVIKIAGVEYARAYGFNYLYFIWAVVYCAVFAVLVPVTLCELIFPKRKDNGWLSGWGIGIVCVLFLPACRAAWFGWNVVARVRYEHLPAYSLPTLDAITASAAILILILLAVGPFRRALAGAAKPMTPPHPAVVATLAVIFSVIMFGVTLMAFGIAPNIPAAIPVAACIVAALAALILVPGWMAHAAWGRWHDVALTYGAIFGNCGIMFLGFLNPETAPIDLWGKTVLDAIAVSMLLWLLVKVARRA
jgi:hypothetical protein